MPRRYRVLVLGASYGSLFGTKLLMAQQSVVLVCTQATADLINREGTIVRFPVKGREKPVEVASNTLGGQLRATAPAGVDPGDFDLVVLAMQEAQYSSEGVRQLLGKVAASRVPCLAIMNMPPLPYLARIPGLSRERLERCYVEPSLWRGFDSRVVTLASPDPQAFRPPGEPKNVLEVGLPTNFKAARFDDESHTAILHDLESGIEAARYGSDALEIPVKLRVHDSVFVPLAKWPMLIAGNYRCIRANEMIPIKDAVHGDVGASRSVYEWARSLCRTLGADDADLVPFEKYAAAAAGLGKPSSAARALFGGAVHIERVDCLIREIALQQGLRSDSVDEIVTLVDHRLVANRAAS